MATPEEKINYQFSGYQMPLIQLDATGPAYIVVLPHPYYTNQPSYWQRPSYTTGFMNTRSFSSSLSGSNSLYQYIPNYETKE